MSNNISSLFENLMTYNESASNRPAVRKRGLKESEQTVLNLAVELPNNVEDIEPDDVNVDVGVMVLDSDEEQPKDTPAEDTDVDEIDIADDSEKDDKDNKDDKKDDDKAEESVDVDSAKQRIMKRAGSKTESADEDCAKKAKAAILKGKAKTEGKDPEKCDDPKACKHGKGCECEACKSKKESKGILSRDVLKNKKGTKTESKTAKSSKVNEALARLDVNSLNKLITDFVKENYKNIDKIKFNKAMLENNKLTLTGTISDTSGKTESITFVNRGFDTKKLENKSFLIDFKDMNRTFNVVKEGLKQPFTFKASMKNGVVKFESLKVNFKTKVNENKTVQVKGAYALTESKKTLKEDANQVKKFNEIVDKIKAAKSGNDLVALEDEINKANLGDTLKSAAQIVWDDVNSRMVGAIKK